MGPANADSRTVTLTPVSNHQRGVVKLYRGCNGGYCTVMGIQSTVQAVMGGDPSTDPQIPAERNVQIGDQITTYNYSLN